MQLKNIARHSLTKISFLTTLTIQAKPAGRPGGPERASAKIVAHARVSLITTTSTGGNFTVSAEPVLVS